MAEEAWKKRLTVRMTGLRHSMKSLSLAAGLGETGVRDMLKRTQSPSVDAVAKVARALGMTLSDLYEGENAPRGAAAVSSIDLIGQVVRGEATWSPLVGVIHTVVIDGSGAPCDVRRNEGLVAAYDGDSIAVFEKVDLSTLSESVDGSRFLILTKGDKKHFAAITVVESGFIMVALPGHDLELELSDVKWIAKWKQTIPRSSV